MALTGVPSKSFLVVVVAVLTLTTSGVIRIRCCCAFLPNSIALAPGSDRISNKAAFGGSFGATEEDVSPTSSSVSSSQRLTSKAWGGDHAKDARIAAQLVSNAARLCLEYQRKQQQQQQQLTTSSNTNTTTLDKLDGTPVTALDFAIQGYIVSSLQTFENEHQPSTNQEVSHPTTTTSFVGEEDAKDLGRPENRELLKVSLELARSLDPKITLDAFLDALDNRASVRDSESANRKAGHRSWILDPIDGTRGLLSGNQYAIGLALCLDGDIVVGILGSPSAAVPTPASTVMVAVKDHGLRYYDPNSDKFLDLPRRIPIGWHTQEYNLESLDIKSSTSAPPKHPKIAGVDYPPYLLSMGPKTRSNTENAKSLCQPPRPFGPFCPPTEVCCGSLVKYYAVASGQVAGFLQTSPSSSGWVHSWDHAPGILCVQESGGSVGMVEVHRANDEDASATGNNNNAQLLLPPPVLDQPQFFLHDGIVCVAKETSEAIRQRLIDSIHGE